MSNFKNSILTEYILWICCSNWSYLYSCTVEVTGKMYTLYCTTTVVLYWTGGWWSCNAPVVWRMVSHDRNHLFTSYHLNIGVHNISHCTNIHGSYKCGSNWFIRLNIGHYKKILYLKSNFICQFIKFFPSLFWLLYIHL